MQVVSDEATTKRGIFFDTVFEGMSGYIRIGHIKANTREYSELFFYWPDQRDVALDYIQQRVMTHNMYYAATLFDDTKATKQHCQSCWFAWADLDACRPEKVQEKPTFILETSPNRYQALWKFSEPVSPYDAEDINRRIAYKYEADGCDKSGWDLTQLLRIPFTLNHKYASTIMSAPAIKIREVNSVEYPLADLKELLPQVSQYATSDIPMPEAIDLPDSAEDTLQKHKMRLQPIAFHLFAEEPTKDWSASLWQLEMFCVEAGMSREETYVVARESKCNKYKRDNVSEIQLWKEVCRAFHTYESHMSVLTPGTMEPLLTDQERSQAEANRTFIDIYMDWARSIGDAAPQYHQAGAFIILSSLLAGPVKLPTSFGMVVPNVWFMILADTTLTRKTTAMDLAMDIINEVDSDAMMATDGSIEGLFSALQMRAGRPSIFLRDEFSGLLEQMTKKDYYAGMAETLTKLYDGKYQKRILRRDVIEVRDPVLIIFAGGIKDRILQLLQYEHVASGFLPRFAFITAESDLSRIRPLGPPTETTLEGRSELIQYLITLHSHYTSPQSVIINDKVHPAPADWRAQLTPDAWLYYNYMESRMMDAALKSRQPDLMTPMFDRLSKTGLKIAVLLACLRMEETLVVTVADLVKAFSYVEHWRGFAVEVVNNIGRTTNERTLGNVMRAVKRNEGITRSEVMQMMHLSAREAEQLLMTLEQRGTMSRVKSGRTERLYSTVVPNQGRN